MRIIKAVKIKEKDWAELSKLAALKHLMTARQTPLYEVVSDLVEHKERLEYYKINSIRKLK